MAMYRPNMKWLQEELISIQQQTFKAFKVLVWNDDPTDKYPYQHFFSRYLQEIPFEIFHAPCNLGSNKAFEKLTTLTNTPYIAYCDQDDIWLPEKLSRLLQLMQSKDSILACSDMYVIDKDSNVISDSITKVRRRQVIYDESEMLPHLLAKNFITGCTLMMRTDIAQKAIPFPDVCFHDWWLAAFAALSGRISIADKPLMKYRIYEGNQSKPLSGIHSKNEYFEKYILGYGHFIELLAQHFDNTKHLQSHREWGKYRIRYFQKKKWRDALYLWRHRSFAPETTWFELIIPFIPSLLFSIIIKKIQSA